MLKTQGLASGSPGHDGTQTYLKAPRARVTFHTARTLPKLEVEVGPGSGGSGHGPNGRGGGGLVWGCRGSRVFEPL